MRLMQTCQLNKGRITLKENETLFSIALRHEVTSEKIRKLYGEPFEITSTIAYYVVEKQQIEFYLNKGCPNCGHSKIVKAVCYSDYIQKNNPGDYIYLPGAYDVPGGGTPNYGCQKCGYLLSVDDLMI